MPAPLPLARRSRIVAAGALALLVTAPAAAASTSATNPSAASPSATPTATAQGTAPTRATGPAKSTARGHFIVTLKAPPAAVAPRTKAPKGGRFQSTSAAVRDHRASLETTQRAVAARRSVAIERQFTVATNGFSARLDAGQVAALRSDPEVAAVDPVQRRRPTVYQTPDALGLTGTSGVWARVGAGSTPPTSAATAGRGVVVGVLDTGVWPENASFTGPALGTATTSTVGSAYSLDRGATTTLTKADGGTFRGSCTGAVGSNPVEVWTSALCNQKLVSARAFPTGDPDWRKTSPSAGNPDYWSPRDNDGHGTHTASTAAGREVDMGGAWGRSAGIAPGAAVAAYKVCWDFDGVDQDRDGINDNYCLDDSVVAAVDQAVLDGVDVLNYSISGSSDRVTDPVSLAFQRADAAGVAVVAAGSNDGPRAGTVDHVAPWVTTVAAASHTSPMAVADFSGRGPTSASGSGIIKPDLAAPGVGIVAGSVPWRAGWSTTAPSVYENMSGTSMASPHVAGLTALLEARHAREAAWTPSAIRSALMMTSVDTTTTDPFAQGAGYVAPAAALDPGLLLDATPEDMARFAQGQGVDTGRTPLDPTDLNLASIAVPLQGGDVRVTRRFTATRSGTWSVRASLPGYVVTAPASITATAGSPVTLSLVLRPSTATNGAWAKGRVMLTPTAGGSTLHLPIVSRSGFSQPGELSATGRSGRRPIRVASPTSGRFTPVTGLAAGRRDPGTVSQGGTWATPSLTVAAGSPLLRGDLVAANGADDLDLYLQRLDGSTWTTVGAAETESGDETLDVGSPAAGTYRFVVQGYAVTGTASFTLESFAVQSGRDAMFTVNPRTSLLTSGATATPWLVWQGLEPSRVYLGYVRYPTSARATLLRIAT
ncbi:S8 family serine peptidase [Arsenicicoccus bolidensis]|uniref:S8 family serine peptidase n=1 Tax=Arsenicicoccus bolidensis TaxID=229480 RepID=UPI0003FB700A|nr:S8 family serine peptidase [Arsenicicoccus bolidensis]